MNGHHIRPSTADLCEVTWPKTLNFTDCLIIGVSIYLYNLNTYKVLFESLANCMEDMTMSVVIVES